MTIDRAGTDDTTAWAVMRAALWPQMSIDEHRAELATLYLAGHPQRAAFIARNGNNEAVGFVEASIRSDFVNGCETSPVLFLEGIYVQPPSRCKGIATALCKSVAEWGRAALCTEFASDAYLDDTQSHAFHCALGFEETERVIYFRKLL